MTPSSEHKKDIVYYPDYFTQPSLFHRELYKDLLYIPDDYHSLLLLAHTCLFLKSPEKTGIHFNNEENSSTTKYTKHLKALRKKLNKKFQLTALGLYDFLGQEEIRPPIDW